MHPTPTANKAEEKQLRLWISTEKPRCKRSRARRNRSSCAELLVGKLESMRVKSKASKVKLGLAKPQRSEWMSPGGKKNIYWLTKQDDLAIYNKMLVVSVISVI